MTAPTRLHCAGVAAILLMIPALLACGSEQGYHGFNFKNQTDTRISILEVLPNGSENVVLTALDAGNMSSVLGFPGLTSTGESCRTIVLVARDQNQAEVARLDRRICRDEEWVIRAPASATPSKSAATTFSATPGPSATSVVSLPSLSVENGTTLIVSLFVNGQLAGDYAPHSWTWTIGTAGLPPLPWIVEARSPSGRVLTSMEVRLGDAQTTIEPSGDAGLRFDSGKANLSCGRIRILAGWTRSAPPPYGAIPTPTSSPSSPAPSAAQTPGDCAP